jgi:hypothetical protein
MSRRLMEDHLHPYTNGCFHKEAIEGFQQVEICVAGGWSGNTKFVQPGVLEIKGYLAASIRRPIPNFISSYLRRWYLYQISGMSWMYILGGLAHILVAAGCLDYMQCLHRRCHVFQSPVILHAQCT